MRVRLAANVLYRTRSSPLISRAPFWSGVLVLNYHRIGHAASAPFFRDAFSATAADFDRQLTFLKRHADVISADDLPAVLRTGRGRHILITFDDGYLDNYDTAFPLLKQHGLPATFFICTGLLDNRRLAWWDELTWIVRSSSRTQLPASHWLPESISLHGNRDDAFRAVNDRFRSLPGDQTEAFIDHLADVAGTGRATPSLAKDLWMTWEMVREMRAAGMTIGAHTVNHPILSRLTADQQLAEVTGSRDRLAMELGETPRVFAYPVGKPSTFNAETKTALRSAGFTYAFSFYGGHQPFALADPYDFRRTHVDWRITMPLFQAKVSLPRLFARW